ncbi:MAG: hypothetical protein H8D43_04095 [Chloroflexi bacterium]|nr:hypothetical protein [Chloroflexota bacterium]
MKISLPYSTYGLDVVAFIGIQWERGHKQFTEMQALSSRAPGLCGACFGTQASRPG